jgi:hypothetical protein
MLAKVRSKDTEAVVEALIKQARTLRSDLYKTLDYETPADRFNACVASTD